MQIATLSQRFASLGVCRGQGHCHLSSQIILGPAADPGSLVATLFYRYAGAASLATIWVHEAVEAGEAETLVSEAGPGIEIRVRGDFSKYHFTFFQEETKIAQVKLLKLKLMR